METSSLEQAVTVQNESSVEPFCLALFRLAKTMQCGREASQGFFGSMRYDLTCWRMLYFAKTIPRAETHARSGPLFEPSRQRCVCVRVSSALAVTSPFQVTGNMAPVWHTHRGRKHHTQPSTWLHTISAAMTHNLYMSSLYCSPFLARQPTKNMRQPWMMPECPARRERWGITRAISSSKFN